MTVLDRRLSAEFLAALAGALLLVMAVLFARRLYDAFWLAAAAGASGWELARLLALSVPPVLAYALPVGVLVASLLVFGRLAADRERTAWNAVGVRPARLLGAPLLWSLLCCALSFYLMAGPIPAARRAMDRFRFGGPRDPLAAVRPNEVRRIGDALVLAGAVDRGAQRLERVLVSPPSRAGLRIWIAARSATWRSEGDAWQLTFEDGEYLQADVNAPPRSLRFARYTLRIRRPEVSFGKSPNRKAFFELLSYSDRADRVEAWKRVTLACAPPIFVLFGAWAGSRGGTASGAVGRGAAFFVLYYTALALCEAGAVSGRLPAASLPAVDAAAFLGALLSLRLGERGLT